MAETNKELTLNHLFFHNVERYQHQRLLSWDGAAGAVVYSTERFARLVVGLRQYLRNCGLGEPGERVAIFAENRPEWHIADFAILLAGHIVVPVYPALAPGQIEFVLTQSGCRAIVISGAQEWAILQPMLAALPQIEHIVSIDDCPAEEARVKPVSLETIERSAPAVDSPEYQKARTESLSIDPGSVASIVYTSGTTAQPKGVMLTHANLIFDLDQCLDRLAFRTARQALSVLPLPHVFERLLCYGYFRMGIPIAYGNPYRLRELLRRHQPEVMGAVPRMLEKIRDAIEAQIETQPAWKRRIARNILFGASARSPLRLLLAARVRHQLGGLRYCICGGAWLDPDVELFLRRAGMNVLQGYGMTETSPVICLNALGAERAGSVGRPLGRVEVRIGDDGEILTRGPHVMLGYYGDPEATRCAFRDGWLLTGDLGRFDDAGFLTITGRRKEMLVLSNGKNVNCALLEQALGGSRLIQQCFVVGEGRKFVSALVVPNYERLARFAKEQGISYSDDESLLLASPVVDLFRNEIDAHQAEFSNFERVKTFCFLQEEALLDPELMTPTQKMRRGALERTHAQWIGQMYVRQEPFVIPRPGRNPQAQTKSA